MKYAFFIACIIFALQAEGSVIEGMRIHPRPERPYTSFQTGRGYDPAHDIRTDAVIVFSRDKQRMESWRERGYTVQTMYGFRMGPEYIEKYPEEGQTMADERILTCGPTSFYLVPTQRRIDAAIEYFRDAIDHGTTAVIPEEPEFFIQTGYSESFKKEWQDLYGEAWQDPVSSIEARWKASRLKAHLEFRIVKAILEASKAHRPEVTGMLAIHSPVNYSQWGIIHPHHRSIMLPEVEEVIGQVWTGTARSHCKYEGVMAERTFENAYLEYSSLYNLMRGTGKRLWFLMDPLEDHPDRTMEDYQTNYERTLVASLMFPEIDAFEVMPWPDRIFGRVPDDFATKIMTIVTMLGEIHRQPDSELDMGTQGIATFIADSMMWQRGEPYASTFDSFHGMTFPLIVKGIPIQVAQLERTAEPGYLDPYKVLLLSYDAMKPTGAAYNTGIADWVKAGGTLILLGGEDAYNDLPEWWKDEGFASPQDHLLAELGLDGKDFEPLAAREAFAKSEHKVGNGTLIYSGKAAAYFAGSRQGGNNLRELVALGCEKAGVEYRESDYMKVRRGRYVAVRAFDARVKLTGRFVDVFDPAIPLVTDPIIPEGGLAVYAESADLVADSKPRVLLTSCRIEASAEEESLTRLLLTGPLNTKGIVRISTAGKRVNSVTALDTEGKPVQFEHTLENGTLLITHDGLPEGVFLTVEWER